MLDFISSRPSITNSALQLSAEIESNSIGELTNLDPNEVVAHYDTEQLLQYFNQENCHSRDTNFPTIGDSAGIFICNFASV